MERQYVGIDFHRCRSVIVRMSAMGERLAVVRVDNNAAAFAAAMADTGEAPEVVIEATYGWYWIVDWLQEQGATVRARWAWGVALPLPSVQRLSAAGDAWSSV